MYKKEIIPLNSEKQMEVITKHVPGYGKVKWNKEGNDCKAPEQTTFYLLLSITNSKKNIQNAEKIFPGEGTGTDM